MKRAILGLILLAMVIPAYAAGTAYVNNNVQGPMSAGVELDIRYATGGIIWTNGSIAITFPSDFPIYPSTAAADAGYIEAFIMNGMTALSQVPVSNISVDSRTVTITGIALNNGESIKIVYGSKAGFGPGATMPGVEGDYTLNITESQNGTAFSAIPAMPVVSIMAFGITKSADIMDVMQGTTFTYIINVTNFSNTIARPYTYIEDTMPEGLTIINVWADSGYPVVAGKNVSMTLPLMAAPQTESMYIEAAGQPGMINLGTTITNKASVSSDSAIVRNAVVVQNVKGGKLTSSLTAEPATVDMLQYITLVLTVVNDGNISLVMLQPGSVGVSGTGSASYYYGPVPSYVSALAEGSSCNFTWVYTATGAGTVHFTASASAVENTMSVTSGVSTSNQVIINQIPTVIQTWSLTPTMSPTQTDTPDAGTPTFTGTPPPTVTFTSTITAILTFTLTPGLTITETDTFTPVIPTDTPTNTTTVIVPTDTPTDSATIVVPADTFTKTYTPVPVYTFTGTETPNLTPPASTPTRVEVAKTDKNYINTANGDLLKVSYKVTTSGKTWIKIFNLSGEEVRSFYEYDLSAGNYEAFWDGTNNSNKKVGRGMYFIVISQPDGKTTKKVVVTK
ncbi:MAG: DUF11 domain-containing protein [Spirochaetia bacterium]|nr:DUF11 domain-containing protein [Spirochaetia bacterium]